MLTRLIFRKPFHVARAAMAKIELYPSLCCPAWEKIKRERVVHYQSRLSRVEHNFHHPAILDWCAILRCGMEFPLLRCGDERSIVGRPQRFDDPGELDASSRVAENFQHTAQHSRTSQTGRWSPWRHTTFNFD